jgi:hypothetical protein
MGRRNNVVAVRLNEDEFEAVRALAQQERMLPASYVRRQIMLEADKVLAVQESAAVAVE